MQRTRFLTGCTLWLATFFFTLVAALAAQTVQRPMTVRHEVQHDISPPLIELIKNAPKPVLQMQESEPARQIPLPPGLSQLPEDPLQQRAVLRRTPVVANSFEGLGQGEYGFQVMYAPPDTNGAPGVTQYVQWVNTSFAIFDKATGNLVAGPTAGNTLWSGFGGGCQTNNNGDPIVMYDKQANRWVMSQPSFDSNPYLICIAVSTTSDATGTWNRYSFPYNEFDDYPKMGVWPDAYYETFNMFDGDNFVGSDVCAYDRGAMLHGLAAIQICFQQGQSVGGLLPSDLDGLVAPPAGSPNFVVNFGSNSLNLYRFHVDFGTPANSTFSGPTVLNVAPFYPLCGGWGSCVPQPGTANALDSLADRLMYRLAYRNFGDHQSLVVNHSVSASNGSGVRWYEIQDPGGTPRVAQQGTYAPDSSYRWMSSIAMDAVGDIALGYSISSASVYPSIAFAGRVPGDPAGMLEEETVIATGTGSQTSALTRWGDYSAMTIDPVDDCTFWYTQEYIKTNGSFNWNTRIANFKFPGCQLPSQAMGLVPVTPCRVADTRLPEGTFGGPAMPGNTSRDFPVPQSTCGIPSTAAGYSLNVTVVPSGQLGYLTIWPAGQAQPGVSTLNAWDGRVKANAAVVPAGTGGAVSIYVSNDTDVVLDIDGYFAQAGGSALAFYPLSPCRVADTRNPPGDLGGPYLKAEEPRDFPVLEAGNCNVPNTAAAYSLNFTAVPRGSLDYLTVWPTGQEQPYVSTLNAPTGAVTANAAIVPAGTEGKISTYAHNDTDLVIDIDGYFAAPGPGGLSLYPVTPCRVLDTRPPLGSGAFNGTMNPPVDVLGSPCGVPSRSQAYVFNATVAPSEPLGYLTLWPDGVVQPLASILNAFDGATTSNMAIVPAGSQGKVDAYASGLTQLILDISSYFAP